MPTVFSKARLTVIASNLDEEEVTFYLKPRDTSSIVCTQKVRTRFKVQAKHLKRRLANKIMGLSSSQILKQSKTICKGQVNSDDVRLSFKCDAGEYQRFEGSSKVSDLVSQGFWTQESVNHNQKVIYFDY